MNDNYETKTTLNLEQFVKSSCQLCGTQRCNPYNEIWREGCSKWREYINNQNT